MECFLEANTIFLILFEIERVYFTVKILFFKI